MQKKELVSIITPSFNTGAYIAETIQSVLVQTYDRWEMIIVDDCSTDNTDQVVSEFTDPRIRYYKNQTNRGAAICRNQALRKAKGDWIAFLDSDDLWMPQKLELQLQFMKQNHISFSYTRYREMDEAHTRILKEVSGPNRITRRGMYRYCWPGCLTVMYHAKTIGLVQIRDLKKHNDYAMWLKVSKAADCYLLDKNLALYRKRSGSISNQRYLTLLKHHYRLYRLGEGRGIACAAFFTLQNLFWGMWKKIRYVKAAVDTK